ncbi:MAG: VOC family protein, partial [Pseudobdellovibrio sp.]
ASVFKNSKIGDGAKYGDASSEVSGQQKGSVMTVDFEIEGTAILALNGGPLFKFNPSQSFFVWFKTEAEINEAWAKLSDKGSVLMAINKYPWSERYGWCNDKFGVSWQLMLGESEKKIANAFLFSNKLMGKAEEAVNFYLSVFKDSKLNSIHHRPESEGKTVLFSSVDLGGQRFVFMDGPGDFSPTMATSYIVNCENQQEIDYYWNSLIKGGSPSNCGWLIDQFGIAWQIIPSALARIMKSSDKQKSERVMAALMKMKKIDIATLENA